MTVHSLKIAMLMATLGFAAVAPAQIGRRGLGIEPSSPAQPPAGPPTITDPDMVLLSVSVTGRQNEAVSGVSRDRFKVLEDGVEQEVLYFWEDSRPISVGFVFDDSARMAVNDKIYVVKDAGAAFLKMRNTADEFFVVRMSDFPDVVVSFSTNPADLPRNYPAVGETALYDAVHVALDVIKEAANSRKFVVVITSGGDRCCSDNNKRITDQQLIAFALKQPVQIYPIFVIDEIADAESEFVHRDANVLNDLARLTGGRMTNAPNSARGVESIMAELARGLKTQYLVGYKPSQLARDGKRRGIQVKVDSRNGPPLEVWTKAGYYAPKR
jgi:Ca-activated chloride channel family protein